MIKEKRKRKRRFKKFLLGLLIFIAIVGLAFLAAIKLFVVKNVEVEGNEMYDSSVIQETVLNDEYSWNSLYVYFKYKFTKMKAVPFIDTMKITLKSPTTLHIEVYEKGMLGYLYISGIDENAYFDKDGLVVETSSDTVEGVPKIDGISCDKVVLYEKLPIEDDTLDDMLSLTQGLKRQDLVPESISYDSSLEPTLNYGAISVVVGDTKLLTQKLERLKAIYPSLDGRTGTLHLENWTEETTNIVFDNS